MKEIPKEASDEFHRQVVLCAKEFRRVSERLIDEGIHVLTVQAALGCELQAHMYAYVGTYVEKERRLSFCEETLEDLGQDLRKHLQELAETEQG